MRNSKNSYIKVALVNFTIPKISLPLLFKLTTKKVFPTYYFWYFTPCLYWKAITVHISGEKAIQWIVKFVTI